MQNQILTALYLGPVMWQLRQRDPEKTVSLLVAVVEPVSFQHEDGVWQVVENLFKGFLGFLGLGLGHEELGESLSDEISQRKQDKPCSRHRNQSPHFLLRIVFVDQGILHPEVDRRQEEGQKELVTERGDKNAHGYVKVAYDFAGRHDLPYELDLYIGWSIFDVLIFKAVQDVEAETDADGGSDD